VVRLIVVTMESKMKTGKIPETFYQAENELLNARVRQFQDENLELRRKVENQDIAIARYKSDMLELEEHHSKAFKRVVQLTIRERALVEACEMALGYLIHETCGHDINVLRDKLKSVLGK
jgi:hypothetical protein